MTKSHVRHVIAHLRLLLVPIFPPFEEFRLPEILNKEDVDQNTVLDHHPTAIQTFSLVNQ